MSAENVDLARRTIEHFNQTGQILESAYHPDLEYHVASDLPDSGVYHGIEAYRTFVKQFVDVFEEFHLEIEEIFDKGEYVVVSAILRGRVRGTGAEITMPESYVTKMRDGKGVEVR